MLYRVKLARPLPADRNRRGVMQKRVDYANWLMRHAVVNHSIFVDECGYNMWTARSHGRARLGERAYRQVCGQRGRNVTVALAISPTNGLVFQSAFLGGMTGQRFNDFLTQARLNLDPNEHVIFIYDGAPAHNNPAIPGPNSELKKLPPYSPTRRQGIALGNFRTQLLLLALQKNIGTITAAKCGQRYRLMLTHIPRCLNSEEIEG